MDLIYDLILNIVTYITTITTDINLNYSTNYTLIFILKITLCLFFLILIRGGVPRYRYDFLTKLGWIKFLAYILAVFIASLVMFINW